MVKHSAMVTLTNINNRFSRNPKLQKAIFLLLALLSVSSLISTPTALVLGFLMTLFIGNVYETITAKLTNVLLQISVVGLGFGMNVTSALSAGKQGFIFTIFSILSLLSIGFLLTKWLKVEKVTGYLISVGTAICGGSAIAAISPLVKAKAGQISVALAVVFSLNSIALLLFPVIGKLLHLSQHDFGLWCAIAIHDTSSVVGASSTYGAEALQIATTVKLARALWIIPLSIFSLMIFKNKEAKIQIPWFIAYFILAMVLNTYFPIVQHASFLLVGVAKAGLTLTLFLIGAGLSIKMIKNVGIKPLILAVLLWVFISCGALFVITY